MIRFFQQRLGARDGEEGFTVIEMVVALTIVAMSFLSLAFVLEGGLKALNAARQRSVFVQVATCAMESMRAIDQSLWAQPNDPLGVWTGDPNFTSAYPSGQFEGRDAVTTTATDAPKAAQVVTSPSVTGTVNSPPCVTEAARYPYTIRRWVTWSDPTNATYAPGASPHTFKRLTVQVDWTEVSRPRNFRMVSTMYPGNLGILPINNNPPTAVLSVTPISASVGAPISFNGAGSTDPDGDAITHFWTFDDGNSVSGTASVTHSYSAPGSYNASLRVDDGHSDARGGLDPIQIKQQVIQVGCALNQAPNAVVTTAPSPATGQAPFSVNLFGSASSDPDVPGCPDSLSYLWDFGDGTPTSTSVDVVHQYAAVGTYTARLTVTDLGGLSHSATATVTVTNPICTITAGHFRNPPTNSLRNDIELRGNGLPKNLTIEFEATSDVNCSTLRARLPVTGGDFFVSLSQVSETGGVRTWRGTGIFTIETFNNGIQTGARIDDIGTAPQGASFSFSFCAHKGPSC